MTVAILLLALANVASVIYGLKTYEQMRFWRDRYMSVVNTHDLLRRGTSDVSVNEGAYIPQDYRDPFPREFDQ